MIYYNDNNPDVVDWLNRLIKKGLLPQGVVDGRSILDVEPEDLKGFTQCHFFAGIGGWAYALDLAEFPKDLPVWTGSPPCFPAGVLVTTRRGFVPDEGGCLYCRSDDRTGGPDDCREPVGMTNKTWEQMVQSVGHSRATLAEIKGEGHE